MKNQVPMTSTKMASIKHILTEFVDENPNKFCIVTPLLISNAVFMSYFIRNDFYTNIDFNLFATMFIVGVALSLFLLRVHLIIRSILNKCRDAEYIKYAFYIVFLVSAIIFSGGVFSNKTVKYLGFGNYQATIFLTKEGCEALSNVAEIVNISPENTLNNVHVIWQSNNQWIVNVNSVGKEKIQLMLRKDYISYIRTLQEINNKSDFVIYSTLKDRELSNHKKYGPLFTRIEIMKDNDKNRKSTCGVYSGDVPN